MGVDGRAGEVRGWKLIREVKMSDDDKTVYIHQKPRTPKLNQNSNLLPVPGQKTRTSQQGTLDIKISRQIEIAVLFG